MKTYFCDKEIWNEILSFWWEVFRIYEFILENELVESISLWVSKWRSPIEHLKHETTLINTQKERDS